MANSTYNNGSEKSSPNRAEGPVPGLDNESPPNYVTFRHRLQGKNEKLEPFQDAVLTILAEMQESQEAQTKRITCELKEIKRQNEQIQKTQETLEKSIQFISEKYEELRMKVDAQELKLKKNAEIVKTQQEQMVAISTMEEKLEEANRKLREKSIEIRNIPFKKDEDKKAILETMCQTLNIKSNTEQIAEIYRVSTKDRNNKPMIVEMTSIQAKRNFLGALKQHNKANEEALKAADLGFCGDATTIFAGDYLTASASELFFHGRELKRNYGYKHCWASLGKIYIKREDASVPILLKNIKQIEELKFKL